MTAQIIRLSRPENDRAPATLHGSHRVPFRASVAFYGRLWWRRARLTVEGLGWLVMVASIIAAIR